MTTVDSTGAPASGRTPAGFAHARRVLTRRFGRTLNFYLALGCEIQLAADGWAQLRNAGKRFVLVEDDDSRDSPGSPAPVLSTPDLAWLCRRLRRLGVETGTITYPANAATGRIAVRDPDQHLVLITQRVDTPAATVEQAPRAPNAAATELNPSSNVESGDRAGRPVSAAKSRGTVSVIIIGGESHQVLASYPTYFAMRLHSLVTAAVYRCDPCQQMIESTMVATSAHGRVTCPACFASRAHEARSPR